MYNFRDKEENKVYIFSDPHLGHQRDFVWKTRGFASVPEHDDSIINNINATVRSTDSLICLGDWCLNTTVPQFDAYLDRINCQNILTLWGNHNNPHEKSIYKVLLKKALAEKYTEESELYPLKYKNLTYLGHYLKFVWNGQLVILSHYPYYIWDEMQHGAWMLCGHSHYGCDLTKADNTHGRILDVGVDGHQCKPWSFEEIRDVMFDKKFVQVDHHQ